jgi:hypothetical protein
MARYSTSARESISRLSTSAGNRLGRGRGYSGLGRPPPVGAAFEEVSEPRARTGSNLLQTGSRGLDNAASEARHDQRLNEYLSRTRPTEVGITTTRPPTRPPAIADENAPLLLPQPPLSARSNSSRSSGASSTRNLINEAPLSARSNSSRSSFQGVQAEITLASPRARASGIHEHSGVSTRNTRAQTGEPHSAIQQTRPYYKSDHPKYRKGQTNRKKDEKENKVRLLEGPLNLDNPYNQGYFGDALNQLYTVKGVQPRQVKTGPKKK